ncbi:coproporphyrinogen iii oxidase : Coproporphyrinogen III oxidase OS=Myxococcus stipitatus (strain DSM 14675 / JCM 12634 / Mx s8) GN=MYSTI_07371 PE=4 SV=1: Coprogen_oxidas [Gemmataceae bacterium]|nr:coproporphyrinogen iii oxidase : Coproporphyrinogen III oxidase OS=Myxococcus stipitatus (strain DSM 14675 / JCM 12634 / Mx s8) GN=MYSTI_07371 PE=4 SV=1: Coprogen_oxidas [Gemmataceae bacterium]VTU00546.1 coproporphyrinogen iii oxidase : Coproporphyrinogen III oxidase OS=Myxococcus stipitatus (strain DSM 14675 / JCM 12634 / Mx s8) GN=MYSTI_07371 PE=4 SV=1: Coprogen_oxidas [Gemmataceae bacterium]
MHDRAVDFFKGLQDRICHSLEVADASGKFRQDVWERPGGGGGRSRVIAEGGVIEKGGVNFSEVHGEFSPEFAKQIPGDGLAFTAAGVSLVIHPRSPLVPTVHANFRFLTHGSKAWFGGGADLTPYYPFQEDVVHFHKVWKRVCDAHAPVADHAKMKRDCDDYFHLKHRGEARGVGGIFFDYADATEATFDFVREAADAFVESYVPIVERRKALPWTPEQRFFQEVRRGRYVEFNLVYDRGTIFGLKTDGRTESILMSLPPVVRYLYDYRPPAGTPEAELTDYWLKPKDWASM